jgi:hypothetical protein
VIIIIQRKKINDHLFSYDEKGEIKDFQEVQVITKVEKRHFKKGEFYMQTFSLDDLILEKKYTVVELRTLIALKRRLDFNNRIKGFKQSTIANEIGSSQANVSRAIKKLLNDKIIEINDEDYYFTNTYIKGAGDSKAVKTKL